MGSVAGLSDADRGNIKRYIEAQFVAFEKADGWIFWTWKTESSPEWDFQDLVRNGMIPQPFDAMSEFPQFRSECAGGRAAQLTASSRQEHLRLIACRPPVQFNSTRFNPVPSIHNRSNLTAFSTTHDHTNPNRTGCNNTPLY